MRERRLERIRRKFNNTLNKVDTMRKQRLDYPFAKFVTLMAYMTEQTIKSLVIIPCPKVFYKKAVPDTLQGVTFGTLVRLQQAPKDNDYLKTCCALVSVLTGVPADIVASRRAYDVIGCVNMIQSEMERIGKLFQSLQGEKTSEEIRAGVNNLDFGVFGVVDWYAKRMGIIDHEEVFNTPWQRIFQCMRIDHEQGEFERRYRDIITKKK